LPASDAHSGLRTNLPQRRGSCSEESNRKSRQRRQSASSGRALCGGGGAARHRIRRQTCACSRTCRRRATGRMGGRDVARGAPVG
jgi:hypothetical protein